MRSNIWDPFVLNPSGGSFESTELLIEYLNTEEFNPIPTFRADDSVIGPIVIVRNGYNYRIFS